jgi:hypothetical protein
MHARMREVSFFPLECLNSGEDFFFFLKKEINVKKMAQMLSFVIVELASHTFYYKRFPW